MNMMKHYMITFKGYTFGHVWANDIKVNDPMCVRFKVNNETSGLFWTADLLKIEEIDHNFDPPRLSKLVNMEVGN